MRHSSPMLLSHCHFFRRSGPRGIRQKNFTIWTRISQCGTKRFGDPAISHVSVLVMDWYRRAWTVQE
jgi:hypothetical protein